MKKGIALIAMLLLAAVMLSGCNLIGYDAELDGAQVVAKVNDTEITKAEWIAYRDYMMEYEQQYMMQYYGFSMPIDETMIASYGEMAVEQLVESVVIEDKLTELGLNPLAEEDAAEVEEYADSMIDLYKLMIRMQNHPEIETVEEEAERLAAEENPGEAVATMTNAELDAMLNEELAAAGYTREYFVETQTISVQTEKLREKTSEGVEVTDDEVKAEFDAQVASQKESYDANPAYYASAEQSSTGTHNHLYYTPEGYRGVQNLLIMLSTEMQDEITALNTELAAANSIVETSTANLEEYKAEDTSKLDKETLELFNADMAALEQQIADAQATIVETEAKLAEATEAAYAEILPVAEDVLAKVQAGEDFDALLELYGEDTGMKSEPAKTRGYLICEGLNLYVPEFQEAAMALENVGDVSGLVKTSYGYHILKYAQDIESGAVEYTDEIKEHLYEDLLTTAQEAAYEAAVTQWVSEAKVETFPKIMGK